MDIVFYWCRYIFFDWIICWVLICKSTISSNLSGSYRAFCRYKLEWTGFFIHSAFSLFYHSATSLTGHSARRACPELQNPHFIKQRKIFSFGNKKLGRAVEGSVKVFFPGHHLSLLTVQPLLKGLSSFMTVDSAPSPSASRRMTEVGGILWRWKVWD